MRGASPDIGGFIPLEKAYAYDPIPKRCRGRSGRILGAQASVWTEYISTPEHLEYMTFPRLLALSEAVWSPAAGKDYEDFRRRLPYQLGRLDKQDVRFRIPEPDGSRDFYTTTDDHAVVELSRSFRAAGSTTRSMAASPPMPRALSDAIPGSAAARIRKRFSTFSWLRRRAAAAWFMGRLLRAAPIETRARTSTRSQG